MQIIERTLAEHIRRGEELFGLDRFKWKFVCPACGHIASTQDYKDAGAPESAVGFSCVGRWSGQKREAFDDKDKPGPCNYAGGGLIRLSPIKITDAPGDLYFEFAPPDPATAGVAG
jgi:hypothetical protein